MHFAALAAAGLAAVSTVVAAPVEDKVLTRARALAKRHGHEAAPALAKRNNGGSSSSSGSSGITDTDILNFALQLEYLEAQYYHIAAYGTQLAQELLNGTGTRGYVQNNPGKQVPFNNSLYSQYAIELATDETNHVKDLRAALGSAAVAMPEINLDTSFTAAAQAAGVIGMNETFSPYDSAANFLVGAFLFEDLGVTAYNGAAPLIQDKTVLAAAASILAVEAYHAAAIRVNILVAGQQTPLYIQIANKAAAAEASLGNGKMNGVTDSQGNAQVVNAANGTSLAFARTPGEVLNVAYLGGGSMGGFFPNGLNGNIKLSTSASSS